MATQQTPYVTVHLFTNKRFKGNQLAVVDANNANLTYQQMQQIAREFNFSETIFLRQLKSGSPQIRIFLLVSEMEFAGHPVVGAGHAIYHHQLLSSASANPLTRDALDFETNAGTVALNDDAERQTVATNLAAAESVQDSHPILSIVKGVGYVLVYLTDQPENFSAIQLASSPTVPLDGGWAPSFVGVMYFGVLGMRSEDGRRVYDLRVRMIAISLEDPACGS